MTGGPGWRLPLQPIANEPWRDEAACARAPQLFDENLDGVEETVEERKRRFTEAGRVCVECQVAKECLAAVDVRFDDGFRAGHVIDSYRLVPLAEWLRRRSYGTGVLLPREHGTARGYRQHVSRDDMPACDPCLEANRVDNRAEWARRMSRRVAS